MLRFSTWTTFEGCWKLWLCAWSWCLHYRSAHFIRVDDIFSAQCSMRWFVVFVVVGALSTLLWLVVVLIMVLVVLMVAVFAAFVVDAGAILVLVLLMLFLLKVLLFLLTLLLILLTFVDVDIDCAHCHNGLRQAAKEVAEFLGTVHHSYVYTVQEGLDAIREVRASFFDRCCCCCWLSFFCVLLVSCCFCCCCSFQTCLVLATFRFKPSSPFSRPERRAACWPGPSTRLTAKQMKPTAVALLIGKSFTYAQLGQIDQIDHDIDHLVPHLP